MNLKHLTVFHAVASAASVTGGARQLGVSQPVVSRQLADLERDLGVTLLDRQARGVQLTTAGRVLADHAQRIVALAAQAQRGIEDVRLVRSGRLAVGASRTIGAYVLPAAFAAFRRAHPGVALSLVVENTENIEHSLLDGQIDIGFAEGVADDAALDYTVFADDELVLIAAPGHPIHADAPVRLSALRDHAVLMHEAGSGTRAVTEQALQQHGVAITPAMTLASTEALKHTVAAGAGVALISRRAVQAECAAGQLIVVALRDAVIRRPLYCVRPHQTTASPALVAFLRQLARMDGIRPGVSDQPDRVRRSSSRLGR